MAESLSAGGLERWPRLPGATASAARVRSAGSDLLLICVAIYIATAIGRVHELFPVLLPFKPALVAAVLAISLYLLQQTGQRRVGLLRSRTTLCLLGLLLWAALSVPFSLT